MSTILRGISAAVAIRTHKLLGILKWNIQIEEKIQSLPCTKEAMSLYLNTDGIVCKKTQRNEI